MNILVTGATGFLGRHLIPQLLKIPNAKIICICRDIQKFKTLFVDERLECIETRYIDKISEYHPDIVIHLAAKLTARGTETVIEDYITSNISFGAKLLESMISCKDISLFLNFGTVAEYKFGAHKICAANIYGATKVAFEKILEYYSSLLGFKYLHLIPYTIYGGVDTNRKVLDIILESINIDSPVKMSEGKQVLDFINVNDIVSFIIFLINNKGVIDCLPNGERVHLGSGIGHSLREVASIVENISGKKCNINWGALEYRQSEIMHAVAPIGELINIGWKPSHSLEHDLEMMLLNHKING